MADTTKLPQHKRHGSKLVPPLAATPKFKNASWRDERLPEMLWAALLVTGLPRLQALAIFRRLAEFVATRPDRRAFHDITHTGIAAREITAVRAIIGIIANDAASRTALQPLMLLQNLPGRRLMVRICGERM